MTDTKTCTLTESEIKRLISWHGSMLSLETTNEHIERINYLNKRLKEFSKIAKTADPEPEDKSVAAQSADAQIKGWT